MTAPHGLKTAEDNARKFGFRKILGPGCSVKWRIECSIQFCNEFYEAHWSVRTPADIMAKNMRRKDWSITEGKPPLCPKHHHPRKESAVSQLPTIRKTVLSQTAADSGLASAASVTTPPNLATSVAAMNPKILRQVYNHLEDHLDQERKLYQPGWSDEVIAKIAGTSEQAVARVRKESYFDLAEDPEIAALRAAIGELHDLFTTEIASLKTRLEGLVTKKRAA